MKQFYVDTTKYLIGHLPLDNKLLRDASFLHPVLWDSKHGAQAIRRLAVMMPTLSEEVALVTDEWKVYLAGQVDEESATRRAYHYWADVFQEKSLQGQCKYSVLQKLVEGLFRLAHGNADVERSLSANRKTVTSDRTSLGELTIKDHVKVSGEPQNVKITKGLLQASRDAHRAHAKRLADEREELVKNGEWKNPRKRCRGKLRNRKKKK